MPHRRYKRRRSFRRGYDRVGGYYGRYNRPSKYRRVEKKFYDFTLTEPSLTANFEFMDKTLGGPTVTSQTLNDIKQGTAEEERIGRKCTIKNINMRLSFTFLDNEVASLLAADSADETLRIVLVLDKQTNGALAPTLDIFDTDVFNSFRNLANIGRFQFLYDKLMTCNTSVIAAGNGTANDSARVRKEFRINISKKVNIPIEFDSTTGGIIEMRSNNLLLIVGSRVGGRMQMLASTCRLRFSDF